MKIRKALLSEANELSELALHSKATWDYSEEFILACKEDLTITEEYIKITLYMFQKTIIRRLVFLILRNEKALDFLYIHPRYKGKGYGKILWDYVIEKANELGLKSFMIDSIRM